MLLKVSLGGIVPTFRGYIHFIALSKISAILFNCSITFLSPSLDISKHFYCFCFDYSRHFAFAKGNCVRLILSEHISFCCCIFENLCFRITIDIYFSIVFQNTSIAFLSPSRDILLFPVFAVIHRHRHYLYA
jgi:hypothetical protein